MSIYSCIVIPTITVFSLLYLATITNSLKVHAFTLALGAFLLYVLAYPEKFTLTPSSIPIMILYFSISLGCSLYHFENSEDCS
jgi:hypothetical protein